ncbi:MAG: protein kinase domain-containing protein, partial [Gemmatimonadaceae bacterium]
MPVTVTCPGCGSAVPVGDRFCGACGNPITGSALISGEGARFDPWLELLQKLRAATIGEYEIRGELGRGGMAMVFLAHDLQLNRRVAIKVMLPGLTYGERMWDRFLAEARTAAQLDHPHIVYIHSVKEKDRFLYFVMKHIDGRPLDDVLSEHKALPVPVAQTILAEVAGALDYAHREGVIHRDVKPANIMVDQKGSSIVMDFGIARATDTKRFTQTGATIGTPAYMSPEQCHGSETSAASDQYSLGVLAYELLTGLPPFVGTPIELQIAHMQDTPVPIRDRRSELSEELSDAVMRMLSKDPAERWPSLQELVPVFSRGLDSTGSEARETLIEMVRTGTPRGNSFPATPISPALNGIDGAPAPSSFGDPVAVSSSERDAPTKISAPYPVAGVITPAAELMAAAALTPRWPGQPSGESVVAAGRRTSPRTKVVAAAAVALVVIGAFALRGGMQRATPPSPVAATESVSAPLADQVAQLFGDSAAVGPGPAAKTGRRAKPPREVTPDAVALLQLTVPSGRIGVGDTVHLHLQALDDGGLPVTTPQIVWTTSNPRVVRFAGAGEAIA